jgi:hypothetical protein
VGGPYRVPHDVDSHGKPSYSGCALTVLLLCTHLCNACAAGQPVTDLSRHPSAAGAAEGYGCQDDEGAYRGPQAGERPVKQKGGGDTCRVPAMACGALLKVSG